MKLLYCHKCGDIIAPHRQANKPRACECGTFAVWWTDPRAGILRVHLQSDEDRPYASVLGIHNCLLDPYNIPTMEMIKGFRKGLETEHRSKFRDAESVIVRIAPGESSDTAWSRKMPGEE